MPKLKFGQEKVTNVKSAFRDFSFEYCLSTLLKISCIIDIQGFG